MQNASSFDNFLSFVYREDLKILFLRWLMAVNSDQLRAGYQEALRKAQEFEVRLWLFDLRGRGPVSKEDEAWLVNHFFPEAEQNFNTVHYFAYLVAPSHNEHFRVNGKLNMLSSTASLSRFGVFTVEEDAVNWLQQNQV